MASATVTIGTPAPVGRSASRSGSPVTHLHAAVARDPQKLVVIGVAACWRVALNDDAGVEWKNLRREHACDEFAGQTEFGVRQDPGEFRKGSVADHELHATALPDLVQRARRTPEQECADDDIGVKNDSPHPRGRRAHRTASVTSSSHAPAL